MVARCGWVNEDPLYVSYHDREWGVPIYDDRTLFEFLVLESAQAGLSWYTVLKKRENYRRAFHNFDPVRIAAYDQSDIDRLLGDSGIIRNRLKIAAAIKNANAFLRVQQEFGSFHEYIWAFVDGKPTVNHWQTLAEVPASTPTSDRLSEDLKRRSFAFVGSTICYAHMQATGMVMDHVVTCYRHAELSIPIAT